MIQGNYEKVIEKIAEAAGVEKDEINRKVEAKRAKLSGLISKEGAAQVIAAELGVNFDNESLKIEELLSGMRKVNVVGKVINLSPVRTFTNKSGKEGKVVNLTLADETSNIKTVLWDVNHIELIEKDQVKEGTVVEIGNATVRQGEVHLGSFSEFKISSKNLGEVKTEKIVKDKPIVEFNIGESASVRAFIVQSFDPRFFHVCPECKKKPNQEGEKYTCEKHGEVTPEKRALINIVIDDGSETTRAVLFHENLEKLGMDLAGLIKEESPEKIAQEKDKILGKEFVFSGNVRKNTYFDNMEFTVNGVQEVDVNKLIEKLEKK